MMQPIEHEPRPIRSSSASAGARLARARRCLLAAACWLASSLVAGSGWAQDKGRVVTISEVTIVGRVQKPIAAVDVSKIQPRLTLAELKQPFADRIEKALYRAPF